MNKIWIPFLICFSTSVFSQEFLNLDFEHMIPGTEKPDKWYTGNPPYKIIVDTTEGYESSRSLKIEGYNAEGNGFGLSSIEFPVEYAKGNTIEFIGKIKTDNVVNGYAGLWFSASNEEGTQAFDNMSERGLSGANDWSEFSIKLEIDSTITKITFGGLLTGQGTAWFDNFKIFVDGIKFEDAKPKIVEPTERDLIWLKQHIHSLRPFDPSTNLDDDLKILNQLINDTEVVALGETTHGSSEIFKMKNRIIKYLAKNKGFDIFSIEANMPESYKINEYIIDSKGNPIELIKGMHFWTWRTQEILDMVEWMKGYNKSNSTIRFTGFDMQYYEGPIEELKILFKGQPVVLNSISELKHSLDLINVENKSLQKSTLSPMDKIYQILNSIKQAITKTQLTKADKAWSFQNLRIIEQYLDKSNVSRDKFMAENLMWIKSQNPESKIILWAHNDHIKMTGTSMGKYLSNTLKTNYLNIGFAFYEGNYTAVGENGLKSYEAQEAKEGSYEHFFNQLKEPIFLLDLRELNRKNSVFSNWLVESHYFRQVGALKPNQEFYETDLVKDFDMIIFIKKSSNTKLLD